MATTPVPPFANIDPTFVLHADGTFSAAGGGGSVTAVTATPPLASSGGATPDISVTLPSDATKYLDGTGNFTVPAGTGGTVTSVTGTPPISSSGGTTPAISIASFAGSSAGAVPAGPSDATKFLNGVGGFTVPPGTGVTAVTGTPPVTSTGGTTPAIGVPVFVASGASHASGLVPDPGVTGGTTKFLREDASFQVPAGTGVTSVTGTAPVTSTGGTTPAIGVPVFVASGASHASGLVPDPGVTGGTTKFLREDATFQVPSGGTGNSTSTGAAGSEPGSPTAGDLYFPNNGYILNRYASVWANNWGPIYPLTFPPTNVSTIATDTLNGGINNSVTALTVTTGTPPSTPFLIIIGTEQIKVTTASGTSFSVIVRGYNGTTAASHSNGDTVTYENWEWAAGNQSTATVTQTTNNGIYMFIPNENAQSFKTRKRLMGSNTSVRAGFLFSTAVTSSDVTQLGIFLREASTGKLCLFEIGASTVGPHLYVHSITAQSGGTATLRLGPYYYSGGFAPMFMRVDVSGANLLFYLSPDGQGWYQVGSLAKSTPFTTGPDEWGWGGQVAVGVTTNAAGITLIHWVETT